MRQLNIRVPQRLFEEYAVCCQMDKHSQKETALDLLAAFVTLCRRNNSLPELPIADLMKDTPKPTEGTL